MSKKNIDENLIRVCFVKCLVDNNNNNQSLIEIFNLDWLDIFGLICGDWCYLSKISMIVWYEPEFYI